MFVVPPTVVVRNEEDLLLLPLVGAAEALELDVAVDIVVVLVTLARWLFKRLLLSLLWFVSALGHYMGNCWMICAKIKNCDRGKPRNA